MKKALLNQSAVPSFSGEAGDLSVEEWILPDTDGGEHYFEPDMTAMAKWAFRYLVGNPQPPLNHRCRFAISPLDCPPAFGDHHPDPIAVGDTESRMDLEFIYMREMTGEPVGKVEEAILQRILSYVREDGLCWCSGECLGEPNDTPAAMSWTSGHLLRSCAERYRLTNDDSYKVWGQRIVAGLRELAAEKRPLMWYAGGLAGWRDGQWLPAAQNHYPCIIDPLVHFARITGDQDALDFAEAMAEGMVAGAQEYLGRYRIENDGSHCSGNCHISMRAALGVAEVGLATSNSRLIEWARRVYEFTHSYGTDWGWYPENMLEPEKRYWSETCVTGDMVEAAIAFAQAGYLEYWDHIERTVRNYLPEAQFFITPEFERYYRETHSDRSLDDVEEGLRMLRRFEGGFLARQRPNDWVYKRNGKLQINMMGCCPPEGMRSLYLAWRHTIVESGDDVFVNMRLAREADAARVITEDVHPGCLRVEARRSGRFRLRPPSWTQGFDVKTRCNTSDTIPIWKHGYIVFEGVQVGDTLELLYPVPRFTQTLTIGCERAEEIYQVRWLGNQVEEVLPHGRLLPIFTGHRRPLPELPLHRDVQISNAGGWQGIDRSDWHPHAA